MLAISLLLLARATYAEFSKILKDAAVFGYDVEQLRPCFKSDSPRF